MMLACPQCKATLAPCSNGLTCEREHTFVVRHGIPDLRAHGDPYLSRDDDYRAADRLVGLATRGGYREMLAAYYAENEKVSAAQADRFAAGVAAAEARAALVLATWRSMGAVDDLTGRPLLDLGAGTAPLGVAAARQGADVWALDPGLRWLVVAAQRCREAGVQCQLVCANAEFLPFPDSAFDLVAGESVLEHILDQAGTLAEVHRILRPGGHVWMSLPNALSLGPDPHVGLLAAGYFSNAFVARYATRRGMVPPRRHMLSARAARHLVRSAGFDAVKTTVPPVAAEQVQQAGRVIRAASAVYTMARTLPLTRSLLEWVGPTIVLSAARP